MSVAEDTTQIPVPIPEVVAAIVNDLQSTISNTLEAQLSSVSETPKLDEKATKAIMSEGQAIVDETTKMVVKTAENIANIVSDEEKRLTETISRLSIEMEQEVKKATGLLAKIHKFVKLITSCTHRADKSVVKVSTDNVNVKVANVV